jgi:hypothetical protein
MQRYDGERFSNMLKKDYFKCKPFAYDATTYYKPAVLIDIIHGIDDKVVVKYDNKISIVKLNYLPSGKVTFKIGQETFDMGNFMRV